MSNRDEPAFPSSGSKVSDYTQDGDRYLRYVPGSSGLTKRELFAALIMANTKRVIQVIDPQDDNSKPDIPTQIAIGKAKLAVREADALIAALDEEK